MQRWPRATGSGQRRLRSCALRREEPLERRDFELASACIQVGEECQAHCLQQFAAGDTSLAGCAKSVSMMLQMCRALVTAAA